MMLCGIAACDADDVQAPFPAATAMEPIAFTVQYSSGGNRKLTLEEIVALVATKNPSLANKLARATLVMQAPAVAQAEVISPEEDGGPPDSEMPPSAPGILQVSTAIGLHDNNTRADLVSLTSVSSGIAWKTLRTEGSVWTGSMFNNSQFQSGTKRGFDTQVWSNSFPINCTTQAAGIWADSWHTARWWTLEGQRDETADEKQCSPPPRSPAPRFSMSTSSQTTVEGGALTISAGHPVGLAATTTDFGYPAASAGDHVWVLDQTQVGSGASTGIVPSYGPHTVWLRLPNSTGQGEASASVTVVAPDEAGSCDDPLTDVVEVNCNGQGDNGQYAVGSCVGSGAGTMWCLVNQWYDWNEATQRYEFWYTQELYCWYEE